MNLSRKSFLGGSLAFFAASGARAADPDPNGKIFGLDEKGSGKISSRKWEPFSDHKVRFRNLCSSCLIAKVFLACAAGPVLYVTCFRTRC